ncbi:MAG: riboflavin synthase [candidate division Zixibacteria bacterium]|nr:riboflavin synthase [candidate division Zixibacteria bacterium]
MFTGIVEDVGKVIGRAKKGNGLVYRMKSALIVSDMNTGDSININGTCQSVTSFDRESFEVEAIKETLDRTNLGLLKLNDMVNLERSLTLQSRLGGHMVSGHIDCVGEIAAISPKGEQVDISVKFPEEFSRYLVNKGSVAIEGISLTVVEAGHGHFKVSAIPITLQSTNMVYKKIGDKVNLEFDVLAKYIEKMLSLNSNKSNLSMDQLKEKGW